MLYAEPIDRLIKAFSRFPGIGEKTAIRLALYILNSKGDCADELIASLTGLKERVALCSGCMTFSAVDPCPICSDAKRDAGVVCVVCDYKDMVALELSGGYSGRYHVLHGSLAPLKGVGPDELRIKELLEKVEANGVQEVILATGFDAEGDATSTYIARLLKGYPVKLTRIASGIPAGSYVEYMDSVTLSRAMDGRKVFE